MTAIRKGSPVLRWQWAKVGGLFGADLRPLTALRVVLALLVLRATDSITLLRGCYAAFDGMLSTWTP
jgi:hypothetical protein